VPDSYVVALGAWSAGFNHLRILSRRAEKGGDIEATSGEAPPRWPRSGPAWGRPASRRV